MARSVAHNRLVHDEIRPQMMRLVIRLRRGWRFHSPREQIRRTRAEGRDRRLQTEMAVCERG